MLLVLLPVVLCNLAQRPQYPPQFSSNWTYSLAGPGEVEAKGWTLWSGYNQSLYYYMSALEGWEQILTGTKIYNFYRADANCCIDDYGWPLYTNYFQNATFFGLSPSGLHGTPTANWVGSLYTQPIFGFNVTYIVGTEPKTGYPLSYISANVVNYNESEIMYRFNITYEQPPVEWFTIPDFCIHAPPCEH